MGQPNLLSCVNDIRQNLVSVKPQGGIRKGQTQIYTVNDLFAMLCFSFKGPVSALHVQHHSDMKHCEPRTLILPQNLIIFVM